MEKTGKIKVNAPGKVNFYLDILGTDNRGYHLLNTIMHSIELSDIVTIERTKSAQLQLDCTWDHIPKDHTNIAHKTAIAFFEKTGIQMDGLIIHIKKNIPDQAGLGGGSSDAAAVLIGLNHLYNSGLTLRELCEIGVTVGADVPFCLTGGCAFAQGIGEKITLLRALPESYILIVKPLVGISTKEAFGTFDKLKTRIKAVNIKDMIWAIKSGSIANIGRCMCNVFEQALMDLPTSGIKDTMLELGAKGAALTGSGSAVVGLFSEKDAAEHCANELKKEYSQVFLTKPTAKSPEVI